MIHKSVILYNYIAIRTHSMSISSVFILMENILRRIDRKEGSNAVNVNSFSEQFNTPKIIFNLYTEA